jgi:hypothetical protein
MLDGEDARAGRETEEATSCESAPAEMRPLNYWKVWNT